MNNDYLKNNSLDEFINKNLEYNTESNVDLKDILKVNIGKKVTIYQTCNNLKEEDNVFNGIIEKSGNDYIILSDPTSGNWYLFFVKYINFIKFEEEINFTN